MIDCALLMSGLLGADKVLARGGSKGGEATAAWCPTGVTECVLDTGFGRGDSVCGAANASSASFAVTLSFKSDDVLPVGEMGEETSKSNLVP